MALSRRRPLGALYSYCIKKATISRAGGGRRQRRVRRIFEDHQWTVVDCGDESWRGNLGKLGRDP